MDKSVLRMLDANANRACEGLRALEDAARFALEDASAAGRLRVLRHGLRDFLRGRDRALLEARDTASDPGRERSAAGPGPRELEGFLLANAKRAQEALRVLEEFCGKGLGRMELYGLEKELLGRLSRRALQERVRGVYGILDPELCGGEPLEVLRSWLGAGLRLAQLRDKRGDGPAASALAHAAAAQCRAAGALFLVNDDAGLALACGADGAHLGDKDMPVADARRVLGPFRIVGRTVRGLEEARRAALDGADYVALGRLFPSRSKPQAPAASLEALALIKGALRLPVVGIGGIDPGNQERALAAGADAVASVSSVRELLKRPGEKGSRPTGARPS